MINLEKAGRMVLLLDPAELLTRAERGVLDNFKPSAPELQHARGGGDQLLVTDDLALMRKLLGEIFGQEPDFEVRFARNGARGA